MREAWHDIQDWYGCAVGFLILTWYALVKKVRSTITNIRIWFYVAVDKRKHDKWLAQLHYQYWRGLADPGIKQLKLLSLRKWSRSYRTKVSTRAVFYYNLYVLGIFKAPVIGYWNDPDYLNENGPCC